MSNATPTTSKTRLYHLTERATESTPARERIIRAISQQQALFHAAKSEYIIAPLRVDDAMRLAVAGVAEEVAGAVAFDAHPDQLPLEGVTP